MTASEVPSQNAVAVVGMACRLPSAPDPEAYWRLLRAGGDAIGEHPDRGVGGFLDSVADFDAHFFGISPREAAAMDPQQRLALELGWEALEDAGLAAARLRGTEVGVFLGAMADDYAVLTRRGGVFGAHTLTGVSRAAAANRLSHFLGLTGPSLAVDTGQSSSLVAVHLAAASLRAGECGVALAGGVQLNLTDDGTRVVARFGALSPDARCFTFDARANGYVRGEGGGVVVLKTLALARADGDRVLAVLEGSAVNNDGPAEGLTVPSARAQAALARVACARAGVAPADVGYVELHGTGTKVGDPVEAAALGAVYGADRPVPLLVGSAKTNVGHLEGAAGITGLLRAVLGLRHGIVPPSLNFTNPNPAIRFDEWNLRVATTATPWPPAADGRLLAGVSAFGVTGTNCHVVLSAGDPVPEVVAAPPASTGRADHPVSAADVATSVTGPVPWVVTARTPTALRAQAERVAGHLSDHPASPADVAHSLASRSALPHRAVVVGADNADLLAGLRAVAAGLPAPGVTTGVAQDPGPGPVFVFPGQGAQWAGMAVELLDTSPQFRARLTECAEALAPFVAWSLVDVLRGGTFERVDVVQPALWAVMVSLAEVWRSFGVVPAAVVGHSQGEIAAAVVSGGLSLVDGARVVALRSGLIARTLAGDGGMVSVALPEAQVRERLAPWCGRLVVGAVNGPASVVVTGDAAAVGELVESWRNTGRVRRVDVDYASHSPMVERLRDRLGELLDPITPHRPDVPFFSTVAGTNGHTPVLDAGYWYRNLRGTVEFHHAVERLLAAGHRHFVEVSPHPVLTGSVRDAAGGRVVAVGTTKRGDGGLARVLGSAAELATTGLDPDWSACFPGATRVSLPTYAFQRERYWLDDAPVSAPAATDVPTDPLRLVLAECAAVLGYRDIDRVEPDVPLRGQGFDSQMLVELTARLARSTGRPLTTAELFDHPTPARLAAHLTGTAPDDTPALTAAPDEPLAIVGMACRYPGGAGTPEDLWRLVSEGVDATGPMPADRGWSAAVTGTGRLGGFLPDAARFDAEFFGISPREAAAMDPQQRLALEVCWEAVERAGVAPPDLRGTRTGVYLGAMAQDYGPPLHRTSGEVEGLALTGTTPSVLSGRVAYTLGLAGPAVTVDTACSSSLVALHLAGQALRSGDCDLALAGGVTVMSEPGLFVEFAKQGGLSRDGRCRPFARAADGTGWAEGAGVLVVERLADALRNGHPVLAVVRGTAVNSDGASNGLTAPSGTAQRAVIGQALVRAGLAPSDVDVVEAHGTGTRLGDPVEANALLATYGQDRDVPLLLGSVKSNLGHTQAAAGVAGVIKMVHAMRHGVVPATLHVDAPSAEVDWSAGAVELVTEPVPWPDADRPRRAGVSSFGISGTNAHVVLEHVPEPEPEPETDTGRVLPWVLSARTPEALAEQAARLTATPGSRAGIGLSLATTRAHHDHRAVVLTDAALAALADGEPADGLVRDTAVGAPRTAFVFAGQGAQRPGMGRELAAAHPVFADALAEVCARLDTHLDQPPLLDVVFGTDPDRLAATRNAQPALFAVEVALARLLDSWGVRPDVLLGHSVGEVAAAHLAGVLSLADACTLVVARGALMGALPSGGAMVAAQAGEDEVAPVLVPGRVVVASVNGARSVVLSGVEHDVLAAAAHLARRGHRTKRLRVTHAFHSPLMEPMLAPFREVVAGLAPTAPRLPLVSTLTGAPVDAATVTDPEYWVRQVREPVRFADALRAAHATAVVEVGPDGSLSSVVDDDTLVVVPALRSGRGEDPALAEAVSRLHAHGVTVDWAAFFAGTGAHRVDLPTTAFRGQRYWTAAPAADVAAAGMDTPDHPLLGAAVDLPDDGGAVLTGRLSTATHPWLADHVIDGAVLVPGTVLVDLALRAGDQVGAPSLVELTIETPLVLTGHDTVPLRVAVAADDDGTRAVTVHSRQSGDWVCHARGLVTTTGEPPAAPGEWPPRDAEPVPLDGFYPALGADGFGYGPAFLGLRAAWRRAGEVFAEVELPGDADRFGLHPALLDAALHATALLSDPPRLAGLPFAFTGVRLHAAGAGALRVRVRDLGGGTVALSATDPAGTPVVTVDSLALRPARAPGPDPAALFRLEWTEVAARPAPVDAVLVGDDPFGLPVTAQYPDVEALGKAMATGECATGLAVLPVLGADVDRVLAELQEWQRLDPPSGVRLAVVTSGAVAADPGDTVEDAAAAAAWGLVRAAQLEDPDRYLLIDLDDPDRLLVSDEPQLAVRRGVARAPRLARTNGDDVLTPPAGSWRLATTAPGTLAALALVPADAPAPGPREVRVAVRAAGLNFRDVLTALDMYPGEPGPLGIEAAGTVLDVGAEVTDLAPGDRVVGVVAGGFGTAVTTDRRLLTRVPRDWTWVQAAATPIANLTAYHALAGLARLRPGEKVLIHAAAGGVGTAAVRIAQHLGAHVYATASEGKRDAVRRLGVPDERIASSRTLDFAEVFPRVDVVLNSLAGEFVDASLRLLAPGGRFVELGKADLRTTVPVGLEYTAFDLLDLPPDRMAALLAILDELVAARVAIPPPTTTWDVRRAPEAFRFVSQGRHVGKVVLTVPPAWHPDGTVLITGGTGGLGLLLAGHLAERHAVRHLLLTGRRGVADPDALARLRDLGVEVTVAACDAGDPGAVADLVADLPAAHPLTAVVHAAGVLDDGVIPALTPDRLARALRPKVAGAHSLWTATRGLDLAAVVAFSSLVGTLGAAGQAGYAAANAHLDAVIRQWRATGVPAQTLAWGPWERTGGMTEGLSDTDLARLTRYTPPMSPEHALALFDAAIAGADPAPVPTRLDPAAVTATDPPAVRALGRTVRPAATATRARGVGFAERLRDLGPDERADATLELVRREAAAVLGLPGPDRVPAERSFRDTGFDSLTGVELRNRLTSATGTRLSPTAVFDHPTPAALAGQLLAGLGLTPVAERAEILVQLDRLDALCSPGAPDPELHEQVALRLELLRTRWGRPAEAGAESLDFDLASDNEVFDLLDNELGLA
ncbi:type I polyketide synthase [Actinophytocola oryzae]|uniref:6-deoxyerythronolide-B synthase n=1 Tax=Actinophytocola oryzae TaxID=502181 RepID=A0A4R7VFF6_9PSEU|nr:type I polyketide synthase [Actinophytocola oryzae]TDV47974.1 acyl transferase domain-containing protein [Actinophytocola oryzae]